MPSPIKMPCSLPGHLGNTDISRTEIDSTIKRWSQHMDAKVFFDGALAGARNVFLAFGSGRLHIYDQAPKDRAYVLFIISASRIQNLREVWLDLQAKGVSSAHGLLTTSKSYPVRSHQRCKQKTFAPRPVRITAAFRTFRYPVDKLPCTKPRSFGLQTKRAGDEASPKVDFYKDQYLATTGPPMLKR